MSTPLTLEELDFDLACAKLAGLEKTDEVYWIVSSSVDYNHYWALFPPTGSYYDHFSDKARMMHASITSGPFKWYFFRTEAEAKEFYDSKLNL